MQEVRPNQMAVVEKKEDSVIPTDAQLRIDLKRIRDTALAQNNPFRLDHTSQKNLRIVLNTLDYILSRLNDKNFLQIQAVHYPQKPQTAPIHLESYQTVGIQRKNEIIMRLLYCFILSFDNAQKAGMDEINDFCSLLSGNCIDARTSGAMDYAKTCIAPFTEKVRKIVDRLPADKSTKLFPTLAELLTKHWGNSFTKDTSTQHGYFSKDGQIDHESFPAVVRLLKDACVADLDNSFLALYKTVPGSRLQLFLTTIMQETDFLINIKFDDTKNELNKFQVIAPQLLEIACSQIPALIQDTNPAYVSPLDFTPEPPKALAKKNSPAVVQEKQIDHSRKKRRIQNAVQRLDEHRDMLISILTKASAPTRMAFFANPDYSKSFLETFQSTAVKDIGEEKKSENLKISTDGLITSISRTISKHLQNPKYISFSLLQAVLHGFSPEVMVGVLNNQKQLFSLVVKEHPFGSQTYKVFIAFIFNILIHLDNYNSNSLLAQSHFLSNAIEFLDDATGIKILEYVIERSSDRGKIFLQDGVLNRLITNKKLAVLNKMLTTLHQDDVFLAFERDRTLGHAARYLSADDFSAFLNNLSNRYQHQGVHFLSSLNLIDVTSQENISLLIRHAVLRWNITPEQMVSFCLLQQNIPSEFLRIVSALSDLDLPSEDLDSNAYRKMASQMKSHLSDFVTAVAPSVIEKLSGENSSTLMKILTIIFGQLLFAKADQTPAEIKQEREDSIPPSLLTAISKSPAILQIVEFIPTIFSNKMMLALLKLNDKNQPLLFKVLSTLAKDRARELFMSVLDDPELSKLFKDAPVKLQSEFLLGIFQPVEPADEKAVEANNVLHHDRLVSFIKQSSSINDMASCIANCLPVPTIIEIIRENAKTSPLLIANVLKYVGDVDKAKSLFRSIIDDKDLLDLVKAIPLNHLTDSLSSLFSEVKASEPHAEKCVKKVKAYLRKVTDQTQLIRAGIALDVLTSQPIKHDVLHSMNLSILAEHARFTLFKNPLAGYISDYLKVTAKAVNKIAPKQS